MENNGAAAVAEPHKTANSKPDPTPRYVSVKIDAEVYRALKTVAAWKEVFIGEYLSELVRPLVDRDLRAIGRK